MNAQKRKKERKGVETFVQLTKKKGAKSVEILRKERKKKKQY